MLQYGDTKTIKALKVFTISIFARYFLGVNRFTPVAAILGEMGWLPARYRRWLCMIRYWNRLNTLKDTRLTKILFWSDYANCARGKDNWCAEIKTIFNTLGMHEQFSSMPPVNMDHVTVKITDLSQAYGTINAR